MMKLDMSRTTRPLRAVSVPKVRLDTGRLWLCKDKIFGHPGGVGQLKGETPDGLLRGAVDLIPQFTRTCPWGPDPGRPSVCFCRECEAHRLAAQARFIWTASSHPERPPPTGVSMERRSVANFLRGGCGESALELWRKHGKLLIPFAGWVILPIPDSVYEHSDNWTHLVWEHCWTATRFGVLVDPSIGVCGVQNGWAYYGSEWTRMIARDASLAPTAVIVRRG